MTKSTPAVKRTNPTIKRKLSLNSKKVNLNFKKQQKMAILAYMANNKQYKYVTGMSIRKFFSKKIWKYYSEDIQEEAETGVSIVQHPLQRRNNIKKPQKMYVPTNEKNPWEQAYKFLEEVEDHYSNELTLKELEDAVIFYHITDKINAGYNRIDCIAFCKLEGNNFIDGKSTYDTIYLDYFLGNPASKVKCENMLTRLRSAAGRAPGNITKIELTDMTRRLVYNSVKPSLTMAERRQLLNEGKIKVKSYYNRFNAKHIKNKSPSAKVIKATKQEGKKPRSFIK